MLFYCGDCNTGYDLGVPSPCPVCSQYGGLRPNVPGVREEIRVAKRKRGAHNGTYVSAGTKLRIYRRDEFTCVGCGVVGGELTIDHRMPRSKGGSNEDENLQTMCRACNQEKSNRLP